MHFKSGVSSSTGMNVPCEDAKNDINNRIRCRSATHVENCLKEIEGEDEFDDRLVFDDFIDFNETTEINIVTWINDIKEDATNAVQAADDGDRDNLMESSKPFAEYFIKLCHMLPIWSAVCCEFFNSPNLVGSSWSSETGFKNTKQLHGEKLPCSVDEFVKSDLEFNNGTVVDASKRYLTQIAPNRTTSTQPKSQEKSSSNQNSTHANGEKSKYDELFESDSEFACTVDASPALNEDITNVEVQIDAACPVCADGNAPTRAHKCYSCHKFVHALLECSVPIGDEEGYGEKRLCISSHRSAANKLIDETETTKALNAQEKWARKTTSKSSKDLKRQPNWGLLPINRKTAIAVLANENLSTTVYTIKKNKISLANTCGIDSDLQLTAAAYAYHPAYSLSMMNSTNEFLRIAEMMATGYL